MNNLNVQDYIDNHKMSKLQLMVFILGTLVIFMDGLDSGVIGFVAPSLLQEWGISKSQLAPVLSGSLVGMAIGALVAGALADKFGRKWIVCLSTLLFGGFTLLSAYATGVTDLFIYRFITGLGLGAAMPNIATLVSEYMPKRNRAKMVNFMFCAFPLGITMGGLLSAKIIPSAGWSYMFIYCGMLPFLLGLLLIAILPESVQFLINQDKMKAAKRLMIKITGDSSVSEKQLILPVLEKASKENKSGVSLILSPAYRFNTFMLWLCCFMSLLVFYLLTSWMPVMLKQIGFTVEQYSLLASVFPFGGVFGTAIIGYMMDKFKPNKTLMITYFISALLFAVSGLFSGNIILFGIAIFLSGAGLVGAQSSLPALTAINYPVQGRASGVSWMHGIGRTGAICGAMFGAPILALNLSFTGLLLLLAIPIVISGVALWLKDRNKTVDVYDNSENVVIQ